METFKKLWQFNGDYSVGTHGTILSHKRKNDLVLKTRFNGNGYKQVNLSHEGKEYTYKVHVLVAIAYLNHERQGMKRIIDHINDDKTDNRVENLRIVSNRQNLTKRKRGFGSKHIGVTYNYRYNCFQARIHVDGNRVHLGIFKDEDEAGKMYEFARNNLYLYNGDVIQFRNKLKIVMEEKTELQELTNTF